ncbi:MAG: hypothetical protein JRG73_13160 [Deltaproteobacteria bacterium]|nr:hypothetical protein [Deltaproteobacteria bacterium]
MSRRIERKKKFSQNKKPSYPKKGSRRTQWILGGFLSVAVAAVGGYVWMDRDHPTTRKTNKVREASYKLRETRNVLSSDWFTGRISRAYRVADAIPHVLDQLYCWCKCKENFGHISLLTCFTTRHAAE